MRTVRVGHMGVVRLLLFCYGLRRNLNTRCSSMVGRPGTLEDLSCLYVLVCNVGIMRKVEHLRMLVHGNVWNVILLLIVIIMWFRIHLMW